MPQFPERPAVELTAEQIAEISKNMQQAIAVANYTAAMLSLARASSPPMVASPTYSPGATTTSLPYGYGMIMTAANPTYPAMNPPTALAKTPCATGFDPSSALDPIAQTRFVPSGLQMSVPPMGSTCFSYPPTAASIPAAYGGVAVTASSMAFPHAYGYAPSHVPISRDLRIGETTAGPTTSTGKTPVSEVADDGTPSSPRAATSTVSVSAGATVPSPIMVRTASQPSKTSVDGFSMPRLLVTDSNSSAGGKTHQAPTPTSSFVSMSFTSPMVIPAGKAVYAPICRVVQGPPPPPLQTPPSRLDRRVPRLKGTVPPPPDHYTCHRCKSKGHWIEDCDMPRIIGAPPPHYVCHRCHCRGHWIEDCEKYCAVRTEMYSYPPARYVCKNCGDRGHWSEHCWLA